jgi:dihydropteroate synthase
MSAQDTIFSTKLKSIFTLDSSPIIMGILNITPDSFFDGGNYLTELDWLIKTEQMIIEGANIIDIGAYSTRPGAKNITEEEETKRLIKAIQSIRKKFPDLLISADTFRASVAKKAIETGANIINDISGGTLDNKMFKTIAKLNVPYVLMHIHGTPKTMQKNPTYTNVVSDVYTFFEKKIAELNDLGVSKIIIDPGFGFGKTLEHNYQLLNNLKKFHSFNLPLLVGFSRKSMINKLLNTKPENALNGTTVLNTIGINMGAKIIRVHDIKEAKEVLLITEYLKKK